MATNETQTSWRKDGPAETAEAASPPETAGGVSRRTLLIGGVVGAVALLWLVLFLTVGGDFYETVEEVQAAPAENVRVGGMVAPGSLVQEGNTATFSLEGESGAVLDVRYVGAFPERLGAYEQVVAEGSLGDSGTLEATEVLVKCPDKLLPEKITNTVVGGAGLERILY